MIGHKFGQSFVLRSALSKIREKGHHSDPLHFQLNDPMGDQSLCSYCMMKVQRTMEVAMHPADSQLEAILFLENQLHIDQMKN